MEAKARKLPRSYSLPKSLSSPIEAHDLNVARKQEARSNKRRQQWEKTTNLPALIRKLSRRSSAVDRKAFIRGGYSLRRTPARISNSTKFPVYSKKKR
ncbi:hypothetical protein VTO42DRAFT_3045 [Malbranchea cinnamomea]